MAAHLFQPSAHSNVHTAQAIHTYTHTRAFALIHTYTQVAEVRGQEGGEGTGGGRGQQKWDGVWAWTIFMM